MTFQEGDQVRVLRTRDTETRGIAEARGVVLQSWGARGAEYVRVRTGIGSYTLGATVLEKVT